MTESSRQKLKFAQNTIVPLLQSILALRQIGVYGSVAKGEAKPASDIDLIIVCQDDFLHLCRWQVNWSIWRAGLRGNVSAGVVVTESALKTKTFQFDKNDQYTLRWFRQIKWIYKADAPRLTPGVPGRVWNSIAKIFFKLRFFFDRLHNYPVPHIKFSDEVFFHFGDSRARYHGKGTENNHGKKKVIFIP